MKHLLCFLTVGVEMGDWQEVWDENSGCYYYWNTTTNEVSWELPHFLANQVQSLEQNTNRWEKQIISLGERPAVLMESLIFCVI